MRAPSLVARPLVAGFLGAGLLAGCAAGPDPVEAGGYVEIPRPPDAQTATVVRHTDGDTLTLRGRGAGPLPGGPTKVRLLLVDTPEIGASPQCGGPEASAALRALVPTGTTVTVEADRQLRDRFGRTLLHVWTSEGAHVGQRLLAQGHAAVLVVRPNTRHLEAVRSAERAGRGLRRCPAN